MIRTEHAVYIVGENDEGYVKFFNSSHFYLIVQSSASVDDENRDVVQKIGGQIVGLEISSLHELEDALADAIKEFNLPTDVSISAGYINDKVVYLKTVGEGLIYIKRGAKLGQIITGEKSASGYLQPGDTLVLTTLSLKETMPEEKLQTYLDDEILDNAVKKMHFAAQSTMQNSIAFFVRVPREIVHTDTVYKPVVVEQESAPYVKSEGVEAKAPSTSPIATFFDRIRAQKDGSKKSMITFGVVGVIFVILIWSVVLGYQRRVESQSRAKIETAKELITQKLIQAEEVAFLNVARSQVLIAESRAVVQMLKTQVGSGGAKEVQALEQLIASKENQIVKKEEKTPQEFFDLTVDNKGAEGVRMGYGAEELMILDKKNNTLYTLSTSKKSLSKKSSSQLSRAQFIGMDDGVPFFFIPEEGMYNFSDTAPKKIIEKDSDWDVIKDFAFFNSNIYILDSGKNQIYKYVVTDAGYGGKSTYFKESNDAIENAVSLSIDSSLYVSVGESVKKFTSGGQDEFATEFPGESVQIDKVLTNAEIEKVYLWDKKNSTIYVLGKTGAYERQIKSSILGKASDVAVVGEKAYVLLKEKIYTLDLQ